MTVEAVNPQEYNDSLPPDTLRFVYSSNSKLPNKTYAYTFKGGLDKITGNAIDIKVCLYNSS